MLDHISHRGDPRHMYVGVAPTKCACGVSTDSKIPPVFKAHGVEVPGPGSEAWV